MTAIVERQHEYIVYRPTVELVPAQKNEETVIKWLEWMNDPEILQFMYDTEPYTHDEIARWVKKVTSDPRRHYFSIIADSQDVGFVSLRQDEQPKTSAEIGIVIGDKYYWDKGIGSQTVKQVETYAKNEIGLTNIRAMIKPENERSIRLFTNNGYHEVARVRVNDVPMVRFEKKLLQTGL